MRLDGKCAWRFHGEKQWRIAYRKTASFKLYRMQVFQYEESPLDMLVAMEDVEVRE